MARPFFVLLSLSLLLSACTQRLICPAFQSAYIYDKDELRKKFSYFLEDSTPKIYTASKTKYLIAEPVSYRKKVRSLQTVKMKPVNVVLPDSMRVDEEGLLGEDGVVPGAELDLAARSVIDSTFIVDVPQDTVQLEEDSVYMISKDKELRLLKYNFPDSLRYDENSGKHVSETASYAVANVTFNVEQDNYMWYLRGNLILPDVRLAQMVQSEDKAAEGKRKKKVKKGGFFKNLFKKKNKEAVDSTAIPLPPAKEFDFVDESAEAVAPAVDQEEAPQEKKRLFSKKKKQKAEQAELEPAPDEKKPKKKQKEKAKAEEEKPEEEQKDDGF
jgi:hypothetical protein